MTNLLPLENKLLVKLGDLVELTAYGCTERLEVVGIECFSSSDIEVAIIIPNEESIAARYGCCYITPEEEFVNTKRISWAPDINKKYCGKYLGWLNLRHIDTVYTELSNGCTCIGCKLWVDWAAPNQPDNTFKCYSCKQNPIRTYY